MGVREGEDYVSSLFTRCVCCDNTLLLELGGEVVSTSDELTIHEDLGDGVLASDGEDGVEADVAVTTGDGDLLVLDALVGEELLGTGAVGASGHGEDGGGGEGLGVGVDVLQHGHGIGDLEGVTLLDGLDEHLLDDLVLDEHAVTPRALAEADLGEVAEETHALGELAVTVGEEGDVLGLLLVSPLVHDEGVVDGGADDLIDAVLLEDGGKLVVAGEMGAGAGGGEGSGEGEEDNGLVLEEILSGLLGPLTGLGAEGEDNLGDSFAFHCNGFVVNL